MNKSAKWYVIKDEEGEGGNQVYWKNILLKEIFIFFIPFQMSSKIKKKLNNVWKLDAAHTQGKWLTYK